MPATHATPLLESLAVRPNWPNHRALARALVLLSAAGSLAAIGFLLAGQGGLALRVVAGDVLALLALLLAAA